MKNLMIIGTVFLLATTLNASLSAAENTETIAIPTPEVIKCENTGTCEMTPVDKLETAKNKMG